MTEKERHLYEDGNGPPKVKRLKVVEDVGMTSSGCDEQDTIYGALIVLGYNGSQDLGGEFKHRHRSSYILRKKASPSGVQPYKVHQASSDTGRQIVKSQAHSVSYTLSRGNAVVVEYSRDPSTDMFQIGRSADSNIDFVIMDTIPGNKRLDVNYDVQKSTISRYSCRIVVDRERPHTARVFAAGFDRSSNIFLGEKAPKWQNEQDMMDGLTTNGVLLMNPTGGPSCQPTIWREISVCGKVYGLRKTRSTTERGKTVEAESNILLDGSLIDLCGAVLLWRSAEALRKVTTIETIDKMREVLNASRPQCPVGLTTLRFPSREPQPSGGITDTQPHVYLKCGHVHGFHHWDSPDIHSNNKRTCPVCLQASSYVPLSLGREPTFYQGEPAATHAFVPCGHVCSEETVKFWQQIPIPHGCDAFQAICPYCAVPLEGEDGFVKLIFSTDE
ncbi:E3 ubiquitin-protein ligase pellino homolog 2-like [Acropora muricata]|uniref:E3 ubiquitin-protein ligase pellino homolog 2-like n=2 Tax=Acropora TaxID=6127 RepID=UPI0010FCB528|nr:E3 ubiquitin-protein ligase pellino homolog 2-like [Acropora millepora]